MSTTVNSAMPGSMNQGMDPSTLLLEMEKAVMQAQEFFAAFNSAVAASKNSSANTATGDNFEPACGCQDSDNNTVVEASSSGGSASRDAKLSALRDGPSSTYTGGVDKTPEADYKGSDGLNQGPLQGSIEDAKANMYAQVDEELDAVLGKGQYDKPEGHYQYVQRVHEAMKQLSPEQQRAMKNRLEIIGQPFHTNFGLTRIRQDAGSSAKVPISLNAYNQGWYSGAQAVELAEIKKRFHAERDAALGRS
jgi:hypothetical protein